MIAAVSRRHFLCTAALGSAGLAIGAPTRSQPAKLPVKPNLIVFLPDQLRADAVAGETASSVHAPNIHKLAAQSVIFDRAYVTQPICTPSRSSLMSGTWPHLNGATSKTRILYPQFRCLPEMLADSDYRTAYFGKWHLGDEFSAQHGFEEWLSVEEFFKSAKSDHKIDGVSDYTKFLLSKGYKPDSHSGKYFSRAFAYSLPFELSMAKFLEKRTCEFLQAHRNEPFLVFVAFVEPHPPYNGPFNNEHSLDTISLDASSGDTFGEDIPLRCRLRQELFRHRLGNAEAYRKVKQKYFGLITELDHCIGAILAQLDDLGLTERTITVLSSDHGDMMSAHGLLGKQMMFEESARVPYLVRMPGQKQPIHCTQAISHIDFAPTMLDLLGKPQHSQCVGQSKAKLVRGETCEPEPVFIQWSPVKEKINKHSKLASQEQMKQAVTESTRAIFTPDGWKLCLRDKDKNELYNLRGDPAERHNLYYDNSHADMVSELTTQIHRWQEGVGDSLRV
jgi:arylsulfatase A-like enzyme